jgi:Protein of unknown function (DUF3800)
LQNPSSSQDDLYHGTYKPMTERFQYYLQDVSKQNAQKKFGIIVADHRGQADDRRLRSHHQKLLYASSPTISTYRNLIEGLFLEPSNLSLGIQLADMVAGAVWHMHERGNDKWYQQILPAMRKGPDGKVDGYGLIKFPKKNWE